MTFTGQTFHTPSSFISYRTNCQLPWDPFYRYPRATSLQANRSPVTSLNYVLLSVLYVLAPVTRGSYPCKYYLPSLYLPVMATTAAIQHLKTNLLIFYLYCVKTLVFRHSLSTFLLWPSPGASSYFTICVFYNSLQYALLLTLIPIPYLKDLHLC